LQILERENERVISGDDFERAPTGKDVDFVTTSVQYRF
jgi:hypothetical protein